MIGVIMSAVTLMTLFAVGVYLMQSNMDQGRAFQQKLGNMTKNINQNTTTTEQGMKKHSDSLNNLSSQITGMEGKLTGMQNTFKSQFEEVNKSITDVQSSVKTNTDKLTQDMAAVKRDYALKSELAKEVKSDTGVFTKINVNGATIFVNKDIVEVDKGFTVQGPLKATSGFEFGEASLYTNNGVVGMKVGNKEVLSMDGEGNASVPAAFSLTSGGKKAISVSGVDSTFYGSSVNLDGRMSMGEKVGKLGLHSDKDMGIYIKGKNKAVFTDKNGLETTSITFPEGGDVYKMIKEVEGKVDTLKLAMDKTTSSFQIHGSGKRQHKFAADGVTYHSGNLGLGIETPEAPLHINRQDANASMRFQSGTAYMDAGIDTAGQGFVSMPASGFAFKNGDNNAITFDGNGTATVRGKLCIGEECLEPQSVKDVMNARSQIGSLMSKIQINDNETRIASKQLCVNNVCTNDQSLQKMGNLMTTMTEDPEKGYTFDKNMRFTKQMCVGDTCLTPEGTKQLLADQTDLKGRVLDGRQNWVRTTLAPNDTLNFGADDRLRGIVSTGGRPVSIVANGVNRLQVNPDGVTTINAANTGNWNFRLQGVNGSAVNMMHGAGFGMQINTNNQEAAKSAFDVGNGRRPVFQIRNDGRILQGRKDGRTTELDDDNGRNVLRGESIIEGKTTVRGDFCIGNTCMTEDRLKAALTKLGV